MGQELGQIGRKLAQTGSPNSCGYGNVDKDGIDDDEKEEKEDNDEGDGDHENIVRGGGRVTLDKQR